MVLRNCKYPKQLATVIFNPNVNSDLEKPNYNLKLRAKASENKDIILVPNQTVSVIDFMYITVDVRNTQTIQNGVI